MDMRHEGGCRSVGLEGSLADEHLVGHYSHGVQVGTVVGICAQSLFWSHVLRGSQGLLRLGEARGRFQHPGEAEVGEYGLLAVVNEDIARLHVAVQDLVGVGEIERLGQGRHVGEHLVTDMGCPVRRSSRVPPGTSSDTMKV